MSRCQRCFLFSSLLFVYSSTLPEDRTCALELAENPINVTHIVIDIYFFFFFCITNRQTKKGFMLCQTIRKFALVNKCRALCALPCAPLFSNPSWSTGDAY